jgi:hypothetical protein
MSIWVKIIYAINKEKWWVYRMRYMEEANYKNVSNYEKNSKLIHKL